MSKKGVVIASVLAAAVFLSGCALRQPVPSSSSTSACQAGPSAKLSCPHHYKYHYKHTHK